MNEVETPPGLGWSGGGEIWPDDEGTIYEDEAELAQAADDLFGKLASAGDLAVAQGDVVIWDADGSELGRIGGATLADYVHGGDAEGFVEAVLDYADDSEGFMLGALRVTGGDE